MNKFVDCERDQAFLLPPDLRDWIPEDDLAHFVIEAVERVEMSAFKVNHRGTGSAQYHPRMMLALLIYCYANGKTHRNIQRNTPPTTDSGGGKTQLALPNMVSPQEQASQNDTIATKLRGGCREFQRS